MSQSEKPFTVSDRRHFTAEGRPRDERAQHGLEEPAAAHESHESKEATSSASIPNEPAMEFSQFLLGLAAQAGQLISGQELPEGTTPEQALSGARSIVAILEMLKDKTEGRRTPEEERLLGELLFQLRLAYVERTRAGKP